MKLSRNKGFTLVEIMIVVAIIGIIIAIAVPAFLRARENSRGQACQENLSKVDGAKEQYAIEARLSNDAAVTWDDLINPVITNPDGSTRSATAGEREGYLKQTPQCPAGGTYSEGNIGTNPTCSIGTSNDPFTPHVLPQ